MLLAIFAQWTVQPATCADEVLSETLVWPNGCVLHAPGGEVSGGTLPRPRCLPLGANFMVDARAVGSPGGER